MPTTWVTSLLAQSICNTAFAKDEEQPVKKMRMGVATEWATRPRWFQCWGWRSMQEAGRIACLSASSRQRHARQHPDDSLVAHCRIALPHMEHAARVARPALRDPRAHRSTGQAVRHPGAIASPTNSRGGQRRARPLHRTVILARVSRRQWPSCPLDGLCTWSVSSSAWGAGARAGCAIGPVYS